MYRLLSANLLLSVFVADKFCGIGYFSLHAEVSVSRRSVIFANLSVYNAIVWVYTFSANFRVLGLYLYQLIDYLQLIFRIHVKLADRDCCVFPNIPIQTFAVVSVFVLSGFACLSHQKIESLNEPRQWQSYTTALSSDSTCPIEIDIQLLR